MITDPLFFAVAIPAVLIVGVSKGGFGGGLAIVAVPLMSIAIAPPQAAGIMLPILCLMDLYGIWVYRRSWDRAAATVLLPAGLIGVALGAAFFRYLDEGPIRILVGAIALAFVFDAAMRHRRDAGMRDRFPRWLGRLLGAIAGFTSFVAHAGGPPVTAYLLTQRLDKAVFAGTSVMFFTTVNYVKLAPYAWLGQLAPGNLATSASLAPVALAGVALGAWLNRRISDVWFLRLVHVLLLLTGLKLVADGLFGS